MQSDLRIYNKEQQDKQDSIWTWASDGARHQDTLTDLQSQCDFDFGLRTIHYLLTLGVCILLCMWDQGDSVFRLRRDGKVKVFSVYAETENTLTIIPCLEV
jgi:hypothetical protein